MQTCILRPTKQLTALATSTGARMVRRRTSNTGSLSISSSGASHPTAATVAVMTRSSSNSTTNMDTTSAARSQRMCIHTLSAASKQPSMAAPLQAGTMAPFSSQPGSHPQQQQQQQQQRYQQQQTSQPTPHHIPPPPRPIPSPHPLHVPSASHSPTAAATLEVSDDSAHDLSPSLRPSLPASTIPNQSGRVSVMAFYVGQKLDLVAVVQANFLSHRGYKVSDDILVVPLEDRGPEARGREGGKEGWKNVKSAVVVFKHGSVVFFNVEDDKQARYLHAMTRHCGEVVPQSHRFRETLECRLRPWQEKYHEMGQDVVHLRELNEDSIKVVADVIGHSVALNFYNKKADRMLEDFRVLNNSVEGSGVFTEMDKKDLFKLVALNNKILTDAMSSGLLEQSKPAWNFNRLDALWNDLRHEFSIGDRFGKVEHKITHVQSNTKFFLEVLNHQKSNKLEWIIIVLIAAEIVLSCIDLYHQILV